MKSPHPLASLDQIFTGVSQSIQGGASLIISGDPATALYIVRRGLFAVCAPGPENRLVGLVGLGEPIGEMALLRGAARRIITTCWQCATAWSTVSMSPRLWR